MKFLATIKNHLFQIFFVRKVLSKEKDLKVLIKVHLKNLIKSIINLNKIKI